VLHSLIVAAAENGVIGRGNQLPWHLPADLAHFKRTTLGHPVIMGRRTWESIGKPLPGRRNVVVSRTPGFAAPGCEVARDLASAYELVGDQAEAFVIGGTQLYEAALPGADRVYLTRVLANVDGDARFPGLRPDAWRETLLGEQAPDERNAYAMRFYLLERQRA
jgi:dihydrofolate reductase